MPHHGFAYGFHFLLIGFFHGIADFPAQVCFDQLVIGIQPTLDIDPGHEVVFQRLRQAGNIPLLFDAARRHEIVDDLVDDIAPDGAYIFFHVGGFHQAIALVVDRAPLIVGNVIVFQQLLADIEVVSLDFSLRPLDLTAQHLAFDRFALAHADARQ